MSFFVLEIGTEEIPSRFLKNEKKDLETAFANALEKHALNYASLRTFVTPRRASVIITGLCEYQKDKEILVQGPAKNISFSGDGKPTKALEGFLASNNAAISDIETLCTEKGEYIALRKKIGGKSAGEILSEICPEIIKNLVFPKSMHWGSYALRYARPIKWILAILDDNIVPFTVGHLSSGRETYGHRVHGCGPYNVDHARDYENIINEKGKVVLNEEMRRQTIVDKSNENAAKLGGKVIWNDDLLEEVTGLVETPVPIIGEFDAKFLELPREVLLTSMQSHQKSFGVEKDNGELLPFFVTVLNMKPDNYNAIKTGWEKVLRARLEDARFFWEEDLQTGFERWLDKLNNVIFIGALGTLAEKSARLKNLASYLASILALDSETTNNLLQAASLSKADLVSGMVGEFDSLQGIMGGIYAQKLGSNNFVAEAIKEQYLPVGPESPLPKSVSGALLSIADKIDTVAGCFGLNMIPTGSADPNGLRRCALGIIRIVLANQLNISLKDLLENAYKFYGQKEWKVSDEERYSKIENFFKARLRNYFQNEGYETILVDAVLDAGADNIFDCARRLESLNKLKNSPDWLPIMQAVKRIQNIQEKNHSPLPETVDAGLLLEPAEKEFFKEFQDKAFMIDQKLKEQDYSEALALINLFIPALNNMFDNVMIMTPDEKLKLNRFALLNEFSRRFARIANISLLQV